jgi:hypothetical protein
MKIDENFMWGVSDAVKKLRPNAKFEITNTDFTQWWDPTGLKPPSWNEIMEVVKSDEELYVSLQYARDRKAEYPKVEDQLDAIWHALNDNIGLNDTEWFKTIKQIKEKYPK